MKGEAEPLPLEVALVWALFLLDAVAILVTYSRLPRASSTTSRARGSRAD